ncbi:hypothetical protein V6U90_24640 [Micromonospora sp. CPCC 206060]|uniref:hypothetical protein n=1 Tax=Micromonospora sp. CPCC 206060 TaxID=3122406 RepID=UPI002FF3F7D6
MATRRNLLFMGLAAATDGQPGFWAMSVEGDTAVVTLHSSRSSRGTAATIDRFWRGYDRAEITQHNFSTQSVCSTDARRDVVCYQNSHPNRSATGRYSSGWPPTRWSRRTAKRSPPR